MNNNSHCFKVGDIVELSDHDLNIDLIGDGSEFANFLTSKRYFTINSVDVNTIVLKGMYWSYDYRRFRIAKNQIIYNIINEL